MSTKRPWHVGKTESDAGLPKWGLFYKGGESAQFENEYDATEACDALNEREGFGGWIACSERMPDPPADPDDFYCAPFVFVATRDGEVRRGRPVYLMNDDCTRGGVDGWRTDGEGWDIVVTHWRPLPNLPETGA